MVALRGVPLREAFRQFSGEAAIAELAALKVDTDANGQALPDAAVRRKACSELHSRLHANFAKALCAGWLHATAFEKPISLRSQREDVSANVWELLDLDIEQSEASGSGLWLIRIEITFGLPRPAPPASKGSAPSARDEVSDGPEFEHNQDYSWVRIREHSFRLNEQTARLIARYHAASLGSDPALNAKAALAEASFKSQCLSSVLKNHKAPSWRELLAPTNKRGYWQLNLQSRTGSPPEQT